MMRQDLRQKIKKIHPKVIVSNKNLTFAHKRLLKDLQDIENDPIPLCGVTACPLETNIFIWHANLRGPRKTAYEGGVYHLQIRFPQTYPSHPPTIQILNQFTHPNVFSGFICLDFIQLSDDKTKQSAYQWNSSYSAQSILYQLQGFLWNQNVFPQSSNKIMVDYANRFWCNVCKHRGADAPWPSFNDKDSKLNFYQLKEDTLKIECEQLKCFHTKLNFKENQLGLGLFISKIPKTGLIKQAIIFEDYISIKAFIKQSINKTTKKEEFNHWLPLYFGKEEDHEKFYFFLKRTLSMIMTNSTKYFKPQFVLEVIPKIFINLVYQIMDRNKYVSISLIRIFTSLHSIFLYCIRKHPELAETISTHLQKFIKEEEYRTKDHTPNLGCFLAYLLVSDSYQFSDLIQLYFKEQLDRHVFWILKAVPELISKQLAQNADSVRTQLAFDCQKTSFHIICFYKLFLSHCKRRESMDKILNQYEDNLSRFSRKEENQLQNGIFQIFKKVKSFQYYFQYVGLEQKSQEQINEMLKEAIVNSERKKYHSQQEIQEWQESMNLKKKEQKQQRKKTAQKDKQLDLNRQIVDYFQEVPTYQKFIQVKLNEQAQGKNEPLSYIEQQSTDQDWRELCLSRWSWIKQCLISDHSLTPDDISNHAFEYSKNGASISGERLYKLHEKYLNVETNLEKQRVRLPKMTWKTLFLRLDLQDFLKYFNMSPDFPKFYEKLFVCNKSGVNTLLLPIIETSKIKSDYFYITAVLTRLTTLKYFEIADLAEITKQIPRKAAKAINKGLHNFYQQKGRLEIVSFNCLQTEQSLSQYFFKNSYYNDSITSFRMNSSNLFTYSNGLRYFSTSNFPELEEISINNCNMNVASCKILADLLIKLKKLRIFRMKNEKNLGRGMTAIVANLAFNSALRLLDIGEIVVSDYDQLVINLGKTIKINSNLEYLLLNDIPQLHKALTLSFWTDLGQSISLIKLDISNKIPTNSLSGKMNSLGRAIAFNAKKKGSLSFINISGSISNHSSIVELYNGMLISEYDEEEWYGSPGKLMNMIPQNYQKVFYNNLKELNFNFCSDLDPPFSLHQYKQLVNPEDPGFANLIADSPHLQSLSMKKTNLTKNIAELLYVALDMNRPDRRSALKILNLSQNQLGSEGAVTLAHVLESNHQLQVLDLSKTNIGVYGIDKISSALKSSKLRYLNLFNNKVGFQGAKSVADNLLGPKSLLQFIEIGHNRIRRGGLQVLVNAVISNPELKLAVLGLRFNYLSNQAILSSFKKLLSQPHSVKEVFLRNNLINDFGLCELKRICEESKSRISVDILEKSDYLNKSKANRTIWIHPVQKFTLHQLRQFFETTHKCGIIMDIRLRKGKKYPNRKGNNIFCFIEFADESGPKLALSLAALKKTVINKVHFRVYKSGQGSFAYRKRPLKLIKLEQAKKTLPQIYCMPKPVAAFKVVKPSNVGLNVNENKAANKCQERYLDHIKPKNPWKKRIAYLLIAISIFGAALHYLDLQQIKSAFFEQSVSS